MRLLLISTLLISATALRADPPRVVTDIAPVHGLVSQVMQGVATPDLVIPPGASPHGYAMRPSEARALSRSDVVFWVGPLLTPWMADPIETLAADARHVSLAEVPDAILLPLRSGARFEPHDHDHDHGHEEADGHDDKHDHAEEAREDRGHEDHAHDDHAHDSENHDDHGHDDHDHDKEAKAHGAGHADHMTDAHLWLDPQNAGLWLSHIAEVLSEHDPENAARYRDNADAAKRALEALQEEIAATVAPMQGKPFIVFHDAYHYFEARFGIEAAAAVTLGDGGTANAARLAKVRDVVAETGAICALAEPRANAGLIEAVAEGAEIAVVRVDAVGVDLPLGADFYPMLLRQIARGMANCLR